MVTALTVVSFLQCSLYCPIDCAHTFRNSSTNQLNKYIQNVCFCSISFILHIMFHTYMLNSCIQLITFSHCNYTDLLGFPKIHKIARLIIYKGGGDNFVPG